MKWLDWNMYGFCNIAMKIRGTKEERKAEQTFLPADWSVNSYLPISFYHYKEKKISSISYSYQASDN